MQNTFYCNDHTITEFGIIDSKNSSTAYVILYELIDTWFLDSNRRVGVWSLPWRWHILFIPLMSRNRRRNLWVGWCVSSRWPLFPPRSSVLIYIYIYAISIFIYEFCFLWFTNCVLLSDDNSLIPGCLWLLAFVLNNTLILGMGVLQSPTSQDVFVPGPSFRISDSTWCHQTPLCHKWGKCRWPGWADVFVSLSNDGIVF